MPDGKVLVRWVFDDGETFESHVPNMTDFLTALKAVDCISHDGQEFKVRETELVIDEEPWIVVAFE